MNNHSIFTRTTTTGLTAGALLLAIATGACGSTPTSPTPPAPTLSQIQSQIFDPSCVACHTDVGRTPAAGMNLKSGAAFAALVNLASPRLPGAIFVVPGNPNGSYLLPKLEGTAGIVGARMPPDPAMYLSDAQVQMIRDWIRAGALNN